MRLDWGLNSMPTPELRDSRAAVTGLVVDLPWVESFSYRFRYPQHINLLELEALISLIHSRAGGPWSRKSSCALFGRQARCFWISVQRAFQQSCELPSSSTRGSLVRKQFVARFVLGAPLGQITATHHRVSTRLASGGRLCRCFSTAAHHSRSSSGRSWQIAPAT